MSPEAPFPQTVPLPAAPLTLDGSYVLHQLFRIRWPAWRALGASDQRTILDRAMALFASLEQADPGRTALYSVVGHKGDLMILHFRRTLDELNQAELRIAHSRLREFLEPGPSYVSVIELGLYEASVKLYAEWLARGLQPGTAEWNREVDAELARQREASAARLWPEIPLRRYLCFYPMNKLRGEHKNWYSEPIARRQAMMREHGLIGRRYAGRVIQIISGSIGFDDWEWGVDLFADDPLVFKKLVYEMRFDEASAVYGLFGGFFVGLRFPPANLPTLLEGRTPAFT
ncbi:MAG TPA: hydrogen peroxide-dependent heme synthase [candidate division Zixibacteria bacterium]|nr:hydrogen peroxide-dependent heme synthase [candidate division Zixibacteria bacterium]